MEYQDIYNLQEHVLKKLQEMSDHQFNNSKLCGGTALSRCWLNHRVSYDLDFFLKEGFKAQELLRSFKKNKINYEIKDIVDDNRKANQLHGYIVLNKEKLKVSFVEDSYFDVYNKIKRPFGSLIATTESIDGLYHRKLRTVSGAGSEGDYVDGGRQKARDLFDLFVLSQEYMPIKKFIKSIPYVFPSDAFNNGLISMPWFQLIEELSEIKCDKKYKKALEIDHIQSVLCQEIDAKIIADSLIKKIFK